VSYVSVAIMIFIALELSNVLVLYFAPGSRLANGVGAFAAWEKSKADPEVHQFVRYLVDWIAGIKLIFLSLLVVILVSGSEQTQRYAGMALILSILSFFWRLFPAIRGMDQRGQLIPRGYSLTLGLMIACFVVGFAVAVFVSR